MVDKPKDKAEVLLERFFDWCKEKMHLLDEKHPATAAQPEASGKLIRESPEPLWFRFAH